MRTEAEVVDIDPEAEAVTVETAAETYDDLLVATGASAIELPFAGLEGVFTIHDMNQADAIEGYVTEYGPETATIVGGFVDTGRESHVASAQLVTCSEPHRCQSLPSHPRFVQNQ